MLGRSTLKFSKLKFPWSFKIHCWGGLGSQLFAWAFAEELKRNGFPRKIELVLHTSGVTERVSEIDNLSSRIHITTVKDFTKVGQPAGASKSIDLKLFLHKRLTNILGALEFVIFSDEFRRIRPWTFQIRSHYSHRAMSEETLQLVKDTLSAFANKNSIYDDEIVNTAIHYRLGDLLTLENKTYVSPDRLILALEKINDLGKGKIDKIDVFSDSPEIAVEKLCSVNTFFQFYSVVSSSWDALYMLLNYRDFIATNSKLGIWVTLLRLLDEPAGTTLAPKELEPSFKFILNGRNKINRITFY